MFQKLLLLTCLLPLLSSSLADGEGESPPEKGDTGTSTPSPPQPSTDYPTLEQLKDHLAKLVDEEMDADKDGYVTVAELKEWLRGAQAKAVQDNVDRQWQYYQPEVREVLSWEGYNPEKKEVLDWEKYKNLTFPENLLSQDPPTEESKSLKEILSKTERRWKTADANGDGLLDKEEFKAVLHPEEYPEKMGDVLVSETIEDMDGDGNGEVSLDEYMAHLSRASGPERNDPAWAQAQQSNFANYLDKNKDGVLSREEMREWVIPPYDRFEADAWRLLSVADTDRDSKLTKKDILDHHQYFITAQPPSAWDEAMDSSIKHDEF